MSDIPADDFWYEDFAWSNESYPSDNYSISSNLFDSSYFNDYSGRADQASYCMNPQMLQGNANGQAGSMLRTLNVEQPDVIVPPHYPPTMDICEATPEATSNATKYPQRRGTGRQLLQDKGYELEKIGDAGIIKESKRILDPLMAGTKKEWKKGDGGKVIFIKHI